MNRFEELAKDIPRIKLSPKEAHTFMGHREIVSLLVESKIHLSVIRFSSGTEPVDDMIQDLEKGFEAV